MLLLNLTTEEMAFLTDVSKTVIPLFAALGGAMSGSYLTYRYQKKDKIRDHLFTYKVKTYSALVEGVINAKRELEKIRNDNYLTFSTPKKKTSEIWDDFRKLSAEQSLFISDKTSMDLSIINEAIFSVVFSETLNDSLINGDKKQIYDQKMTHAIYECNKFVKKVQSELKIDSLNSNKL